MAKKLGVGIISTGWVATAHVANFKQIPDCEIVAVTSRKKSRAAEFICEQNLENAEPFGKVDDMLKHPDLDIVVVCSIHPQHPEQVIAAADAGKHIVIEKPVALNRQDLRKMVAVVKKNKVQTSVCFELRWIGLFKNIKAIVEQGTIGELFYGETSYFHGLGPWYGQYSWNKKKRYGGSAVLTAGCHALDGLLWLMNSEVTEVAAMGNTSKSNPLDYDYDPNSVAILKLKNGAMGKVATSIECRQPYLFPCLFQGTKGSIWNDQIATTDWPGLTYGQWAKIPTALPDSGDVDDHPYLGQLEYFVECIQKRRRPHNDLANCAHVHEVCYAIDEAMKKRKTVKVPRTPGT